MYWTQSCCGREQLLPSHLPLPKLLFSTRRTLQVAALDAAVELTGQPPSVVLPLLESCQWNIDIAVSVFVDHIVKRERHRRPAIRRRYATS